MSKRLLVIALCAALGGAAAARASGARAEDLLQIYRDALVSDPTLAAARANWTATQESVPQARAGLLPLVNLSALANEQDYNQTLHTDPRIKVRAALSAGGLYRFGEPAALSRAEPDRARPGEAAGRPGRLRACLGAAGSDRARRAGVFQRAARAVHIELTESQKAAVSENLAQAKRNFEVGTATITDTNDAQAKYDQIVAQEISVRNDLENTARGAARDHRPAAQGPEALRPQVPARAAVAQRARTLDRPGAVRENLQVRIAQANLRHRHARSRPPARRPLSDARPGRELQPELRRRRRVDCAGIATFRPTTGSA